MPVPPGLPLRPAGGSPTPRIDPGQPLRSYWQSLNVVTGHGRIARQPDALRAAHGRPAAGLEPPGHDPQLHPVVVEDAPGEATLPVCRPGALVQGPPTVCDASSAPRGRYRPQAADVAPRSAATSFPGRPVYPVRLCTGSRNRIHCPSQIGRTCALRRPWWQRPRQRSAQVSTWTVRIAPRAGQGPQSSRLGLVTATQAAAVRRYCGSRRPGCAPLQRSARPLAGGCPAAVLAGQAAWR